MTNTFRHSAGFGKRIEYWVIGLMLKEGIDVYVPLVDDDAIDAVIKKHDGTFIEVQIKARSKTVKIAPAIGGSLPPKRISFSFFAPFNFLFSESERKSQCQKNQIFTKIRRKKSTSVHSADPWCKYRDIILGILKGLTDLEL